MALILKKSVYFFFTFFFVGIFFHEILAFLHFIIYDFSGFYTNFYEFKIFSTWLFSTIFVTYFIFERKKIRAYILNYLDS
jgi:hypothetical protein